MRAFPMLLLGASLVAVTAIGRGKGKGKREKEARGIYELLVPAFTADYSASGEHTRNGFAVDIAIVHCDEPLMWLNDWVEAADNHKGWHIKNIVVYEKCCSMPVEMTYMASKQTTNPEKAAFDTLKTVADKAGAKVQTFCIKNIGTEACEDAVACVNPASAGY